MYGELELDADGYADLFDAEVKRVLDIHAPLRTGQLVVAVASTTTDTCQKKRGKPCKQQRRRLERRYQRTGLQSDKQAYLSACSKARESRADEIKSELDEASGDVRATWRTAQRLLHSRQKVVYYDAQCAQLFSMFCQFSLTRSAAFRTTSGQHCRTFAVRQHIGPVLSAFEPATIEEAVSYTHLTLPTILRV